MSESIFVNPSIIYKFVFLSKEVFGGFAAIVEEVCFLPKFAFHLNAYLLLGRSLH